MRSKGKKPNGFSVVELMVGIGLLIAIFAFSFRNLVDLRKGMQRSSTIGPHVFFESFAVSRLKLYLSKLMQWTSHVCKDQNRTTDLGFPGCLCADAAYFAYAGNEQGALTSFVGGGSVGNATLGADLRLSLSTFGLREVIKNGSSGTTPSLIDLINAKKGNPNEKPWGTMIPFHTVDEWKAANSFSYNWCTEAKKKPLANTIGAEMCNAFFTCSQIAGGMYGLRPPNQLGTQDSATPTIRGKDNFSLCFVFAGNLFSRSEVTDEKSVGTSAIDYPSVAGLVVASSTFVNNTNGKPTKCEDAATEMNRSLKSTLTIYTALNVDMNDPKKQNAQKSVREITGEKLGVAIPNCTAPNRGGFSAVGDDTVCIEDPTFIYQCKASCKTL